jgi:pimeloyl-ACP methyl ester carboxylesterase
MPPPRALTKMGLLLGAVAIIVVAGAYGARALAQAHDADAYAIRAPNGVDEAGFVSINGLDQWITIRGQDVRKPVVLVLHGGPGQAQSHLIQRMAPMERDFVVVQWDQRGAGKTLAHAGGLVDPAVDLKTMVSDGLAVTEYLRRHLHRDRIVLLGFSWGSRLGVEMAQARPTDYAAYVGTGQAAATQAVSDAWVYQHLLERATAAGDAKGLVDLREAGAPPWQPEAGQKTYRASAPYRGPEISLAEGAKAAFTAPNWTVSDVQALARGRSAYKATQLERDLSTFDPDAFGRSLAVPVIVIDGAEDLTTPAPLAATWVRRLKAPKAAFAVIPDAGHQALITHNAAFSEVLKVKLSALGIRTN